MRRIILIIFIIFIMVAVVFPLIAKENEKPLNEVNKRAEAYFKFAYGHFLEINNDLDESLKNYEDALKLDPDSSDIKISIADIYRRREQNDRAVEILKEVLEKEPENAMALKELGNTYYDIAYITRDTSYLDKAIEVLEKVREITPEDSTVYVHLGRLYTLVNKNKKAIEILNDFIKRQPDSLAGYTMLEDIYEGEGMYEEAANVYEILFDKGIYSSDMIIKLLDLYQKLNDESRIDVLHNKFENLSQNMELVASFAAAYRRLKNYDKASELYALIYEQEPEDELLAEEYAEMIEESLGTERAIEFLEKHISQYGLAINLGYKLGLFYGKQQDWDKANEIVLKLIATIESKEAKTQEDERILKTLYIQKGFISQQESKYNEAIEFYQKAEAISPLDTRIQLMLAYCYYQNKEHDNAIEIINNARKGANDKTSFNVLLAEIYSAKGETQKAVELFEELVESNKENKEYVIALVEIYEKTRAYEKAEKLLLELIGQDGQNERLYFMLGAVNERQKKYKEAEKYFREALKIKDDFAPALNYLGYMLIDLNKNIEESIGYVKKAVDLDEDNGAYLDSLGWGYYKLNNLDLALKYLQKAIEHLPDNPVICDHLGDVYNKMGKTKEAIEQWKRALQKKSDEINEEDIQQKIKQVQE